MAGFAGLIEKVVTGRDYGKDLSRLSDQFLTDRGAGQGLTNEGLGDLRRISGDYRDLIRKGGLTDAVNREYDVQQGRISDDVVRSGRSFRATLAQQAAQNGGYLSPAAQAELAKENEANVNETAFGARNQLSFEKARISQEATSQLQNRILEIADMIRTTGLTREQLAQMGQLQVAQLQYQRNKAIEESIRSYAGGVFGGFSGIGG